ncbi:hypothetical protein ACQ4PT_021259 [Festuca glaucescens]
MDTTATSLAESMITMTDSEQRLPDDLVTDEILTRLPAAAAARFREVCRAWNAAITSDHFVAAHARRAAARQPETLFFPSAEGPSTSFYTCSVAQAGGASRELLTVGNLAGEYVVLSRRPCHGFTLVRDARSSEHFVFNLSTGDHAVLPRCEPARTFSIPTFNLPYNSRFHPTMAPWSPFEFSSTGLGFDPATGEHKVCEVHMLGSRGWRPCAGDVPSVPWPGLMKYLSGLPPVVVGGSFYWLLWPHSNVGVDPHDPLILSFSIADERFGWVRTPPRVSMRRRNHRIRHLAELDGSLCAVAYGVPRRFHRGEERLIELLTWTPSPSSWKTRCRIDLATLPKRLQVELGRGCTAVVGRREKHRRLCEKCAALGHGYDCVARGWEQMTWTAELRDHLPTGQYIC